MKRGPMPLRDPPLWLVGRKVASLYGNANGTGQSYEDVSCLADSTSLSELSMDGNPFAQDPGYKQTVLRHMQQLRQLDMKRITEDERRIASVMARKEEERKRETHKIAIMKEKRRLAIDNVKHQWDVFRRNATRSAESRNLPMLDLYLDVKDNERRRVAISNARRQWEFMQGSMMTRTNNLVRHALPELYASHVATVPNSRTDKPEVEQNGWAAASGRGSRPSSAKSARSERDQGGAATRFHSRPTSRTTTTTTTTSSTAGRATPDKTQSGTASINGSVATDHLSELEGDTLNLYGVGSLDAFDKNWGIQAAGAVTTICFKFIDFDEITKVLHKIRVRFPNIHTFIFNSTNIQSLSQLNALASVRRLDSIMVEPEGNPVTQYHLWRSYLLFRLAHFSLKKINDVEVSGSDIVNAEKFFGTLAHMTTTELPPARLAGLLGDKKKQLLIDEKGKKVLPPDIGKLPDRTSESVGRAGLVYTSPETLLAKTQEQHERRNLVKHYVREVTYEAIQTEQKQRALQTMWPQVFTDMVRRAVLDMWDTPAYMRRCVEEVERS